MIRRRVPIAPQTSHRAGDLDDALRTRLVTHSRSDNAAARLEFGRPTVAANSPTPTPAKRRWEAERYRCVHSRLGDTLHAAASEARRVQQLVGALDDFIHDVGRGLTVSAVPDSPPAYMAMAWTCPVVVVVGGMNDHRGMGTAVPRTSMWPTVSSVQASAVSSRSEGRDASTAMRPSRRRRSKLGRT